MRSALPGDRRVLKELATGLYYQWWRPKGIKRKRAVENWSLQSGGSGGGWETTLSVRDLFRKRSKVIKTVNFLSYLKP